jgi:hypothetical protein
MIRLKSERIVAEPLSCRQRAADGCHSPRETISDTPDVAHSDFKTTNGIRLEGRGVSPDKPVTQTIKDFRENRDLDLDRVRELLNTGPATH